MCGCAEHAKYGGVIPGKEEAGRWMDWAGDENEEERARINSDMVQTRASHTTRIHSRKVVSVVIPLKRAFSGRIEFDEGSSGTRAVVEVVVLATIVEVVVHGRRGSSRSRFGEELDRFESLRGCRGTCGLRDGSCTRT